MGKNRLVNFALVPPPDNVTTDCSLPTGPKEMRKQLQTRTHVIVHHRQWQGGNSATCWSSFGALDQSIVGRRNFSALPATVDPGRIQSTLLKKGDSAVSVVENPVMSTFVPSASARKMAASIKKKTSSFTTKEFEQFSPKAVKPNSKDETSVIDVHQHERDVETLMAESVERLFLKATKENSKNKTPAIPNERNIQAQEAMKTTARKDNLGQPRLETAETKAQLKQNPKGKAPAKKEGLSQKETKSKSKPPKTEKFQFQSELDPRPRSEDKVWPRRMLGRLNGGSVIRAVEQARDMIPIDAKVRQPTPNTKLYAELQETTDVFFQDLICIPNPDPPIPLQYQIDVISLRKKQRLKPQSINRYWSHQLYHSNDRPVEVHYCDTFEKADDVAKLFMKDNVIGFDMEWLSCSIKSESPRYIRSHTYVLFEMGLQLLIALSGLMRR